MSPNGLNWNPPPYPSQKEVETLQQLALTTDATFYSPCTVLYHAQIARNASSSPDRTDRPFIVRLLGNLTDELCVDHPVSLIEYNHRPCQKASGWTVRYLAPVASTEIAVSELGKSYHIIYSLGGAEPVLGKRQIVADGKDNGG